MSEKTEHPPTQPTVEEVVRELRAMPLMSSYQQINGVIEQACALLSALEKLEKDAARYRWLREQQSWSHSLPGAYPDEAEIIWDRYYSFSGEAVDTAIDLARGATGENNGR